MYVIAYDISSPRRLRRAARLLEKHAVRCQKSVFLFRGGAKRLSAVLESLSAIIEPEEDVVQAWRLSREEAPTGRHIGTLAHIHARSVILGNGESCFP